MQTSTNVPEITEIKPVINAITQLGNEAKKAQAQASNLVKEVLNVNNVLEHSKTVINDQVKSLMEKSFSLNEVTVGLKNLASEAKNFGEELLTEAFNNLEAFGNDVKATFAEIENDFNNLVNDAKNFGQELVTDVLAKVNSLGDSARTIFTDMQNGFHNLVDDAKDFGQELVTDVLAKVNSLGDSARTIFTDMQNGFHNLVDDAKDFGQGLLNGTLGNLSKLGSSVKGIFSEGLAGAQSILGNLQGVFNGFTSKIGGSWQDIGNNIKGVFSGIGDNAANLVKGATEVLGSFFGRSTKDLTAAHTKQREEFDAHWDYVLAGEKSKFAEKQALLAEDYENGVISELEYLERMQEIEDEQEALEEEKAAALAELEEQQRAEKNEQAKKAFESEKKFNIVQAIMAGGRAIMGAWASLSSIPLVGAALAAAQSAVVAGVTAAQVAAISGQQFVPAYANGTNFHTGGLALVGEKGAELVNLPRGSAVKTADQTNNLLDNLANRNQNFTFNFYGTSNTPEEYYQYFKQRLTTELI